MFGSFLSSAIKIATLPIDAAEIVADTVVGGDGSRRDLRMGIPLASDVRDRIAEAAEEIDKP